MNKKLAFTLLFALLFVCTLGAYHLSTASNAPEPLPRTEPTPPAAKLATSFDTIKTNLRDYIWPTDASNRITSTFAEYRTTHFHGGIDISTNGVTGYHVFAVRDGFIYKIKMIPDGYGKMLFVRHPDGYVSTYAHLKGFNAAIEKVVKAEQYRRGTFSVDMTLDETTLPVHKGDVIAYTGNTGVGPPHLHFELRDENMNYINPLLVKSYLQMDNIPPSITRLMITPLRYNSVVENGATPKFFSRFPGRNHLMHLPQRVRIEGEVGFAIDAIDRANTTYTTSGIHGLEFYLDDSLLYSMELDRVPNDETKQIDLHYDLPSITAGTGRFQKLYIDEGNALPFYNHQPVGTGIINTRRLRDGDHDFRVICTDASGNRAELSGSVIVANRPVLKIGKVDEQNVNLSGTLVASISKYSVLGKRFGESRWSQHTLPSERFEASDGVIHLPVNSSRYDVMKITGETASGVQSAPVFYFKKSPSANHQDALLTVEPLRNYTRVSLTTKGMFTAAPNIIVKEGPSVRTIPLEAIDVNKYIGAFDPSDAFEGSREFDASVEVNGRKDHVTKSYDLFAIPPDHAGTFSLNYGEVVVAYDSGAVYSPLYLRISRDYYNGIATIVLDPDDVLLNGGLRVSLPKPGNSRFNHLGLYYRTSSSWRFQTDVVDSNRNYYTAHISRTLGELAIFGDDQPPSIGRLRVTASKGIPTVSFSYHDNLSGVDPDDIKLYIDGQIAIPEIDEGHHFAKFVSDSTLNKGKHKVTIIATDRAKNEATTERILTIR